MTKPVSVVVVTRNRHQDLKHCLGALAAQNTPPDELIVVDNNSQDSTRKVIKNFTKNVTFPVRYVNEKRVGYPIVYNRGLKEAKFNWVAFIDDDCVADPDWFANITKSVRQHNETAAILGSSGTYFGKNMYSLAILFFDALWKLNGINQDNNNVIDFEILDNKNIIYEKRFLHNKHIQFDETQSGLDLGISEDCDLGMQIQSQGGKAVYATNIKVKHKDPVSMKTYLKKIISYVDDYQAYKRKWQKYRRTLSLKRKIRTRNLFPKFATSNRLNWLQQIILLSLLSLRVILERVINQKHILQTTP